MENIQSPLTFTPDQKSIILGHLGSLTQSINWDNYTVDDEEDITIEKYCDLGEALFMQLDWVKENLPDDEDTEELLDYINAMQEHVCPIISILSPE
jgi:hypothetical protein